MIHSQNYRTQKTLKMTINKGQTTPCTFRTPLDYSEIHGAYARIENLATEHPNRCQNGQINRSLLLDINSLFLKNISLLPVLKYPVNFPVIGKSR